MSIPEEIQEVILQSVPIKSLLRCSAVRKSWNSLIKSAAFIDLHLRRTIQSNNQNNTHLLVLKAHNNTTSSLRWDNPALSEYTKHVIPFAPHPDTINVVGICNGLVCLVAFYSNSNTTTTRIWNPCIRKYVTLPSFLRAINEIESYAFGYDSGANDYKVLRTSYRYHGTRVITPCKVEVWSLSSGFWKTLNVVGTNNLPRLAFVDYTHGDACVNGVLHWVQKRGNRTEQFFILGFDMSRELFGEIMIPDHVRKEVHGYVGISRYEDSLALLTRTNNGTDNQHKHAIGVWAMKEYGVAESWTKLFTILLPAIPIKPFCFRKSGREVILGDGQCGSLVSLDYESGEVSNISGYFINDFIDHFVESIVLLDHPDAISY